MQNVLLVALGGGIGAATRYLVAVWAAEKFGSGYPYGTLFVNVAGCFLIGAFMIIATEKFIVSPYWRMLVTVGFLGGLTTFSSFGYETWKLAGTGDYGLAINNVLLNVILSLCATWLGIAAAKLL